MLRARDILQVVVQGGGFPDDGVLTKIDQTERFLMEPLYGGELAVLAGLNPITGKFCTDVRLVEEVDADLMAKGYHQVAFPVDESSAAAWRRRFALQTNDDGLSVYVAALLPTLMQWDNSVRLLQLRPLKFALLDSGMAWTPFVEFGMKIRRSVCAV